MRAKSMAMLMLALGCGLVASIGITQVMAKRNAEPAATGDTVPIFIAVKDVPLGDRLSAEVLKLEAWPKDKVPPGAISKIEDIDGCKTRTKLYAGEPILEKKLYSKGTSLQGDSALIPPGFRVVAVKVDNVSGGPGLIMPGDRVDVLVHLVRNASQDVQETTTRTILQNIKVFAVNDVVDVEQQKDSKDKEKLTAKTISLLVTPPQAATLVLATEMGKVRLVMRSPDEVATPVEGISKPADLLGGPKAGDRDNEKLYKPDPVLVAPATKKVEKSSLTSFFESMKTQLQTKAKTTLPRISNPTWTVRILHPKGVNEIILEADGGPMAEKMPNSWHTLNTSMPGASSGANVSVHDATKPASASSEPTKNEPKSPLVGPPPKATDANPPADPPANSSPAESKQAEKPSAESSTPEKTDM